MKKNRIKKLVLSSQRIAILGIAVGGQQRGGGGGSVIVLGDSCYYDACRLTDAVSLAAPNKTCF